MIAEEDCSAAPAEFVPNLLAPRVAAENGAIYGQVFPRRQDRSGTLVEIHYYHLWSKDCGQRGHPLDAEHVFVLVQVTDSNEGWRPLFWYAGLTKTRCVMPVRWPRPPLCMRKIMVPPSGSLRESTHRSSTSGYARWGAVATRACV
jgi:hypothetical protein